MPKLSHQQMLEIAAAVLLIGSLLFKNVRKWLKGRFKTFDFMPEYFEAMRPEFSNVFWGAGVGATVPYLAYAIYSQFTYPPPLVNWLAIIGAVFLAGYYLWRADHMRLEKQLEIARVSSFPWANEKGKGIHYYLEVLNKSEGLTIEWVNVCLEQIDPELPDNCWLPLPIPLKLGFDNPPPNARVFKTDFNLNPCSRQRVDLVSAYSNATSFSVTAATGNIYHSIPGDERYRLQVSVRAKDTPELLQWLDVWIDDAGVLQCKIE